MVGKFLPPPPPPPKNEYKELAEVYLLSSQQMPMGGKHFDAYNHKNLVKVKKMKK
jgi:hypothetical protein